MTPEEAKHFAKAYIECDLYVRIRAIKEGKFPNEQKMIEEAIASCEPFLKQWHKYIPNMKSFIQQTLEEIEQEHQKVEQMRKPEEKGQER